MLKLFFTFFKIGLFTFGGGYSMIPLISEEATNFGLEMSDLSNFIAISESTPGPFAINIATFIGYNNFGILGAIIATLGVVLPSFIIMMIIAILVNKVRDSKFFKTFMRVTIPIVSGLILSSTIKIGLQNIFNISSFNTMLQDFKINVLTLVTFIILLGLYVGYYIIKKKKLSPFIVILMGISIGVIANIINLLVL
jgi:chromate transporter